MRRKRRVALVLALGGSCGSSLGASTPGSVGTGRAELVPDRVPGNTTEGCSAWGCTSDDRVRLLASATETWGAPTRRSRHPAPTGEWPSLLRMSVSNSDADQARMKEFFTTALAPIAASSGCFLLLMLLVAAAKYRMGKPLPSKASDGKDLCSRAMLVCLVERTERVSVSLIPDRAVEACFPSKPPLETMTSADAEALSPQSKERRLQAKDRAFWRTALHFGFCVVGVMFCHIALGFYQERTMTRTFETGKTFEYGAFLTLCNRMATLCLTCLALLLIPGSDVLGKAPLHEYSIGAYTNLISSMAQYLSLDYVSFPLLVLSKSCKMPPVMLLGYLVHNKSYKGFEYTSAMLVLMGTFFFLLYDDAKASSADDAGQTTSTFGGVVLLLIYIFSDAYTSNWQASVFEKYGLSIGPMMLWSSVFALVFGVAGSFASLEFVGAMSFIRENPSILQDIVVISVFSAVGQFFVLYTIGSYGALTFAAIANVRQVVSALISIVYFQHILNSLQCLGMCTVFLALAAHLRFKWHARATKPSKDGTPKSRWRTAEEAWIEFACCPAKIASYLRGRTASLQLVSVVVLLIGVATLKAMVTKSILDDVPGIPVAFSAISCTVTVIWILPIFALFPASFNALRRDMIPALLAACLLVAVDLTFTNIAIALLSSPLQQCMSALTPIITVVVEAAYRCSLQPPASYLLTLVIAAGMGIMLYGTFRDEDAPYQQTAVGAVAMVFALLATSIKYVALHAIIQSYRKELGALSFLFWFEIFTMAFVVPWSIADGELGQLVATPKLSSQLMLYSAAALGGVRFLSQLLALRLMSPTSLSVANVGAHLLVAAISYAIFHVKLNAAIAIGFFITLGALVAYGYLFARLGSRFDEEGRGPTCFQRMKAWCARQLSRDVSAVETQGNPPAQIKPE